MRRNETAKGKPSRTLMANNKFVFVLSLLIAVVCWGSISLINTKETERTISGVKVQLTQTDELLANYGLSPFDQTDFFVDVTLKGYSYLLRDLTADNIELTASCASVAAAGSYDLPVVYALEDSVNSHVRITKLSSGTIKVYFDKEVEKTFTVVEDVVEKAGYAVAEGYERENPILSTESVTVSGASRDVNKIVSVKAQVELNKTLNSTERLEARLILESDSGVLDSSLYTISPDGPIYITIPVNHTGTYDAVVDFSNMPLYYKSRSFEYTVSPATVDITSTTAVDATQIQSHQISVGTIDFSEIVPGEINEFTLTFDAGKGPNEYTVSIDVTDLSTRTISVPVDTSNITLPRNVQISSAEVANVTVAGPADVLEELDKTSVYAVPVMEGQAVSSAGSYSVPAKIVFRTATNCWSYGKYTVSITVS